MRRGNESGDVGRRSTAEADDPSVSTDLELAPEALDDGRRLRRLAAGDEMGGERRAEKLGLVQGHDSFVGDHGRVVGDPAREDDAQRREEERLYVFA